jgi:Replication-relaxation
MTGRHFIARQVAQLAGSLTERDWQLLRQVAVLRFVSGLQLTRLCFGDSPSAAANARAARRALLRLTGLGLLERLPRPIGGVRAGSAGFVYRLGPLGHRLVILRGWQPERRRRRSRLPGSLFVRHALAVAELHARLTESERSRSFELLELAAEPSCWRGYDGLGGQLVMLKPDSYVRLGIGRYEDSYFIEVDRGTEGTRAIGRQLERYVAYHATGREQAERGVFPRTLWLSTAAERVAGIEAAVQQLPERELFAVAAFDEALPVMLGDAGEENTTASALTA